jgi:hypothetical protein
MCVTARTEQIVMFCDFYVYGSEQTLEMAKPKTVNITFYRNAENELSPYYYRKT